MRPDVRRPPLHTPANVLAHLSGKPALKQPVAPLQNGRVLCHLRDKLNADRPHKKLPAENGIECAERRAERESVPEECRICAGDSAPDFFLHAQMKFTAWRCGQKLGPKIYFNFGLGAYVYPS